MTAGAVEVGIPTSHMISSENATLIMGQHKVQKQHLVGVEYMSERQSKRVVVTMGYKGGEHIWSTTPDEHYVIDCI